jgi:hypothetical protein
LAYKQAVEGDPKRGWRLTVMDLTSGVTTPTAETRSVDDQALWLDDDNLLYRSGEQVWTVRADGTGAAREYLAAADSPAVVR